jgi:predicted site-specific integrase-resolvase
MPDEVSEMLRLPVRRLSRMARQGEIPAVILPDGEIRFDPDELRRWVQSCKRPSQPAGVAQ